MIGPACALTRQGFRGENERRAREREKGPREPKSHYMRMMDSAAQATGCASRFHLFGFWDDALFSNGYSVTPIAWVSSDGGASWGVGLGRP